ncbi:MAG: UDP-N-acetylenolpyruvoylglucosamine reductase [Sodalis sp. Ffu]|nr:MAG: UDP-N-acetylenolpyruvoylglucosamine reductase [Sodalis sp. Ffu]
MTHNVALKPLNTFAIDVLAHHVVTAHTEAELLMLWRQANKENRPILLLGGGSNVLFLESYSGTVLLNRVKGITINEDNEAWHLHVGAGEIWHELVIYSLKRQMPGLENLALIPGCVGSAPIQNIGAYGVELQQLCEYVDILQLKTEKKSRISATECQFSYRKSIFVKHHLRHDYAIVAVGLRLRKTWKPVLSHGDLTKLDLHSVTPRQIFDAVCTTRRNKLPDPAMAGNAGSFFKNPVLKAKTANQLLTHYPDAPHYLQPDGRVKLAAGWLIDHCKLKGYQLGDAVVHDKQALVLINIGQATGDEIAALARYVRRQVAKKFAIWLEPEVRFIASQGEVDAIGVLS